MTSQFRIDDTFGGLTALDALATPLPDPQPAFNEYRKMVKLGDGSLFGTGPQVIVWTFPVIEPEQVTMLETFFTGEAIYISSRKRDDTFGDFEVLPTVPDPRQDADHLFQGVRSGYVVEFIVLSEVEGS
jgi:hypothetical protein